VPCACRSRVLLANPDHVYMMNFARCTTLVYTEKLPRASSKHEPQLTTVRHYVCVSDEPGRVPAGRLHLQALLQSYDATREPRRSTRRTWQASTSREEPPGRPKA